LRTNWRFGWFFSFLLCSLSRPGACLPPAPMQLMLEDGAMLHVEPEDLEATLGAGISGYW